MPLHQHPYFLKTEWTARPFPLCIALWDNDIYHINYIPYSACFIVSAVTDPDFRLVTWWHLGPPPMIDVTMLLYLMQMRIWNAACAFIFSGITEVAFFSSKIACIQSITQKGWQTLRVNNGAIIYFLQFGSLFLLIRLWFSYQQTTRSELSVWCHKIPLCCWIQQWIHAPTTTQ